MKGKIMAVMKGTKKRGQATYQRIDTLIASDGIEPLIAHLFADCCKSLKCTPEYLYSKIQKYFRRMPSDYFCTPRTTQMVILDELVKTARSGMNEAGSNLPDDVSE